MDGIGSKSGWFGIKGIIGVVVGALGLGAMFYGSGIGTETSKKPAPPSAENQTAKPVRAMNLALGPMVFLARELDFSVKNAKGEKLDGSRFVGRVETQLAALRDAYRQEIAKNPKLVGSMVLQFNIDPAGQVSQIKEITVRLNDAAFRQTVAAEAGKWNFAELTTEPLTAQIPLLFVQEGMDITTLVRWESFLVGAPEKVATAPTAKPQPVEPAKTTSAPTPPPAAVAKPAPAAVKAEGEEVQIKYATLLRKDPNFNAPVITTFTIGTKVTVLNRSSDWLEVRSHNNGPSGYIRKEFVVPVEIVGQR